MNATQVRKEANFVPEITLPMNPQTGIFYETSHENSL